MKILAIENELREINPEIRTDILKREASKVWTLQQNAIIREIYLTDNMSKAVIIMECNSIKEANDYLNDLPLVNEGYIDFKLYKLDPYPGYSRLFV
jgi:hypothetical protein